MTPLFDTPGAAEAVLLANDFSLLISAAHSTISVHSGKYVDDSIFYGRCGKSCAGVTEGVSGQFSVVLR